MDQLNFIPFGQELVLNGDAEPEREDLPNSEFLATPLHLLVPESCDQPQAQSPGSSPTFPGRSTEQTQKTMNLMNLKPERSLEWDNLRQIKHADPYGRVTLGRKFSHRTFIVEELTDGAFLLRPAVIMEQRQFEKKLGTTTFLRCPTMR